MVTSDGNTRGGTPQQLGDAARPSILATLRQMPASIRSAWAEQYEQGQRSGMARPGDFYAVDGVPPNEMVERNRAMLRRKALMSCIPPDRSELLRRGLSDLDAADQHPMDIRAWLANPEGRTLILAGPTGNGKTEAGYAALVHAAMEGAAMTDRFGRVTTRPLLCRSMDVNSYIAALRPDGAEDPAWKLRDRVYNCELLLGDDLGAELDTEEMTVFMRDELARLQTWRLEHRLRTIWTTNRRGKDLRTMVGGRMWSRMNQQSTAIRFTGPDRRQLSALDW